MTRGILTQTVKEASLGNSPEAKEFVKKNLLTEPSVALVNCHSTSSNAWCLVPACLLLRAVNTVRVLLAIYVITMTKMSTSPIR